MEKIIYHPTAKEDWYWERTDRNIGWITKEEQMIIKKSTVGIAGSGGMGGLLAATLLRIGFGEIRIADSEVFDISNINRQCGARKDTAGKSKAEITGQDMNKITDDAKIVVYPTGINEETVEDFVSGCDLIFDEIEFFAISARILLHKISLSKNVPLFNCNVVGFGARLFLFTPKSMTMEELLGLSYEEAKKLEMKIKNSQGKEKKQYIQNLINRVLNGLVPEIPQYKNGDIAIAKKRLLEEGKAPICGTTPPFSTGFAAIRSVLWLLRNSGEKRETAGLPEMPAYLFIDAAKMEAKTVTGKWTNHRKEI